MARKVTSGQASSTFNSNPSQKRIATIGDTTSMGGFSGQGPTAVAADLSEVEPVCAGLGSSTEDTINGQIDESKRFVDLAALKSEIAARIAADQLISVIKQDLLISGQNIKTINGKSLVGPGNIYIGGGGGGESYFAGYGISIDEEHLISNTLTNTSDIINDLNFTAAVTSEGITYLVDSEGNVVNPSTVISAVQGLQAALNLKQNKSDIDNITLILDNNILKVNTTNDAERDNTRPITSAGVNTIVGDIQALLALI